MLRSLQDYFPKWLAAFLFGLLTLLIIAAGVYIPSSIGLNGQNPMLARVNGVKIRKNQLEAAYEAFKQQQAQMGTSSNIPPDMEQNIRFHLLKQLIRDELLKQAAKLKGYRIHPKAILAQIKQIPAFQLDGEFSPKRFNEVLMSVGYTRAAFLKAASEQHLVMQLVGTIVQSAFVLPKEIQQLVRFGHQERDFNYLELKAEHVIKSIHDLSEEELRAYYEKSLTDFREPEKVSIEYIVLSYQKILEALKSSDPDNVALCEQKASEKFKAAIVRLRQLSDAHPHSLSETAQALSVDIQSTPFFTSQGTSNEITAHPDVIREAFSQKVLQGHNSSVLHLDSERVILLRVKQHQPLRLLDFEKAKAKVKERLTLQKAKEAAQKQGEQLTEQLKQSPEEASKLSANAKWHQIKRVKQNNEVVPSEVLGIAFNIPSHKQNKIEGVAMPNGDYIIVHLTKVRPGKMSQLKEGERDRYKVELSQMLGQLDIAQYQKTSERRAKIDYMLNTHR